MNRHDVTRRSRSRVATTVLIGAMMLLGPGIAATASSANAVQPQKKAAVCIAPATVTVGFNGTSNGSPFNDLGWTNNVGQLQAHCHTTVKLVYFGSAAAVLAALLGGSIQYATLSYGTLLAAQQQGTATNVVALFSTTQGGGSTVVAPIAYKSNGVGMSTICKYANLTWGVPSIGGAGAPGLYSALKKCGTDPATVTKIAVGTGGLASFVSGKTPIVAASPSVIEPAILNGTGFYVWSENGYDAYKLVGLLPGAGLVALNTTIAQYPELTQQAVNVDVKNTLFLEKNTFRPAAVYAEFTPEYRALTTYTTFAQQWALQRTGGTVMTGLVTQQGMQRVANEFEHVGAILGHLTIQKGWTNQKFVQKAYTSLGLKAPTSQVFQDRLYLLTDKYTGLKQR